MIILLVASIIGILTLLIIRLVNKSIKFRIIKNSFSGNVHKASIISFIFFFLYLILTTSFSHISFNKIKSGVSPKKTQVVILGLDAASWNILVPLLKKGYLKNIEKLIESSAYGYLDTYGKQFTPPVWASIVTGKKLKKHLITNFENTSYDWRAKPLWEIISDYGEKVGTVNWMNTYPALPLNGFMFSEIQSESPQKYTLKYQEDFIISPEKLFTPEREINFKENKEGLIDSLNNEIENTRRVLKYCNNLNDYRLVLFYLLRPDSIQHFFWSDFKPEEPDYAPNMEKDLLGEKYVFHTCWEEIDRFIEDMMSEFNDDTIICILSDHGSRPIKKREIIFDISKILQHIGYPINEDSSDSIISIIDDKNFEVLKTMENRDFSQLVSKLKNLEFFPSKTPLFKDIKILESENSRFINLKLSLGLKGPKKDSKTIKINDEFFPYEYFFTIHPWSGRHRARGMIIINGPGIINRYLGSWLIDSPYFYLFRLSHGRVTELDKLYPILKFFRLVDPVTTLDITPTLLRLLGYPLASDMDGKDMSSYISEGLSNRSLEPIKTYGKSRYFDEKKALDDRELQKIKEKIKALGYVK